jgi:hypothetical protein
MGQKIGTVIKISGLLQVLQSTKIVVYIYIWLTEQLISDIWDDHKNGKQHTEAIPPS